MKFRKQTTTNKNYSFNNEKLKMDAWRSSCSSIRSLAWLWRTVNSLLKSVSIWSAFPRDVEPWWQLLLLNFLLRLINISPNLVMSSEISSCCAWILGPIRCLQRATRFFKFDHLFYQRTTEQVIDGVNAQEESCS